MKLTVCDPCHEEQKITVAVDSLRVTRRSSGTQLALDLCSGHLASLFGAVATKNGHPPRRGQPPRGGPVVQVVHGWLRAHPAPATFAEILAGVAKVPGCTKVRVRWACRALRQRGHMRRAPGSARKGRTVRWTLGRA